MLTTADRKTPKDVTVFISSSDFSTSDASEQVKMSLGQRSGSELLLMDHRGWLAWLSHSGDVPATDTRC